MSTVVEVLRRGRELYASAPSHVADPDTPASGTCCVLTAVYKAAVDMSLPGTDNRLENYGAAIRAADDCLRKAAGSMRLVKWNAENSTETVLEAWDRAIAAAEAKA